MARKPDTALLTLLFTDLAGSMQLKRTLGDAAAVRLIQEHRELVRQLRADYAGSEEIETAGDSFLLVFARPSEAVRFALSLHDRMRQLSARSPQPLRLRVGIHLGEIVIEPHPDQAKPKDLYGAQLDVCARVMELAEGGQVLLTRPVFDNARAMLRGTEIVEGTQPLHWCSHGPYLFKGLEEPVEVCEVRMGAGTPVTPPTSTDKAQRVAEERDLVLGWRPAVGQSIPGLEWSLEEKLGEGGFGEVWLARHQRLGEQRVFKFCFRADRVRSLKREVALSRLLKERVGEHPNIVRLFDVYFDKPPFYIAEEYVAGRDLRRWCEARGGIDQVPLGLRLEIVAQAAEALQAAHDAGIIHRDVKPGNILVCEGPRAFPPSLPTAGEMPPTVKLTDFGIGQLVRNDAPSATLPNGDSTEHTGTQLYMAPELFAGTPASTRSDIYALGVVLYQLLVADFHRPVTTDWAQTIQDPLLRDDLRHCFAGDPSDRFSGAGQLAERLRSLSQRRMAMKEQEALMAARERAAYHRGIVRAAAIAGLILAAFAVLAWQVRSSALRNYHQAAQIRSATVRLTLANGLSPANSGDWLAATLWFAEAFFLDEQFQTAAHEPFNRQTHRLRLNSVFRQSPCLEQMWFDTNHPSADSALPGIRPTGQNDDVGFASGGFDLTGEHVLLGGTNGYSLYSTVSGQATHSRVGQGSTRASLRPDGRRAVTGGGAPNALFTVWDVQSGARLFSLQEPAGKEAFRGDCSDLQFSPDGRWIAAAVSGPRGQIMIWDAETGRAQRPIAYADALNVGWTKGTSILAARFDLSGERLLTAGTDHRAVIWQRETGRALHVLRGHRSFVYTGCFGHRHTNWVVTCSFDRTACLWDLRTDQHHLLQVEHEGDGIQDVQFSPDDRAFATSGLDSTVRLWDSETGQLIPPIIRDHGRTTQVQWNPDGSRVLTISWDGVARLWRLGPGKPVMERTGNDYIENGRYTLSLDQGNLRVRETAAGHDVDDLPIMSSGVSAWCYAGRRDHLLGFSSRADSTLAGFDRVQLWQISRRTPVGAPLDYDPHWSNCLCAPGGQRFAFYSGRKLEVAEGSEQGVSLWEPARASEPRRVAFTNEDVTSVAFDPDGRRLAVASRDRTSHGGVLRLIDLETNQGASLVLRSGQEIPHVTFSRDGAWLAAALSDETLAPGHAVLWRLGEAATPPFAEAARLAHLDGVLCTAFSDSGQTIATGSEDQTAILWHWRNGVWQPSPRRLRCGGQVYACSFSHNDRWLATAHRTKEAQQSRLWRSGIRIWHVDTSEPISIPFPFSEKVTRLAFVADDTRLFVEHWIPPAPPQRWLIDLAVDEGAERSAEDFLLRAELLSGQRSFLSPRGKRIAQVAREALSAEKALDYATSAGPLRPLSKEDCQDLWNTPAARCDAPAP